MDRFSALEDSALLGRMEGLRRAERDLDERVRSRALQAAVEGRWVPSDPLYQRLALVLRQVRNDLRDTRQESAKRATARGSTGLTPA